MTLCILALLFLQTTQFDVAIPKTNPSSWITPREYPAKFAVDGAHGTVGFRLAVASTGRPVGCVIIESTGWKDLDSYTCDILLKKAVFQSWKKTKDNNRPRFYRSKVFWRLPVGKLITA